MRINYDTETAGLNGPVKLIQYNIDGGKVHFIPLLTGWQSSPKTVAQVKEFYEKFYRPDTAVCGWNTSFDLYHGYRTLHSIGGKLDSPLRPVKPFTCRVVDYYLHALRTGPLAPYAWVRSKPGKTKAKPVAKVSRVPSEVVEAVAFKVEERLKHLLPAIARPRRHYHEVKGRKDLVTISFDIDMPFGLKAHAEYWGADVIKIKDVWPLLLPRKLEKPWLPYYDEEVYADVERRCDEVLLDRHSEFWTYARNDIEYLDLAREKLGNPSPDHHDAATAYISYTRYYGFELDREVLVKTKAAYEEKMQESIRQLGGINVRSAPQRLALLKKYLPFVASSGKKVLEALAKEETNDEQLRAVCKAMLGYGTNKQRLDQVLKLLDCRTGRAHPELNPFGTATSRMAGSAGFNWQGVAGAKEGIGVRAALKAAAVGDFESFEVCIAAAAWADDQLLADLSAGTDVHLLAASTLHPAWPAGITYDQAREGRLDRDIQKVIKKCRQEAKSGLVFGPMYGAGGPKVEEVFGLSPGEGDRKLAAFFARYQGLKSFREKQISAFCTADTANWKRNSIDAMQESAQDLTGDKRQWTFEKQLAKVLWELGTDGIPNLPTTLITRQTKKGPQTVAQAVRSSLLGAAIAIQQAVYRQGCNTPIQMTGANICKMLGETLWNRFHIPLLNVHDEYVMGDYSPEIQAEVDAFVQKYKSIIPHLGFDLKPTKVWSDK